MNTPTLTAPVRRPLTGTELARILSGIDAAGSTGDLLATLVRATYDALLSSSGLSIAALPAGRKVDPREFEIPSSQWQAITAAVTSRAAQWGTGAQLALEVINVMPGSYDDPDVPAPALTLPDRRPYVHELHVSREASDVIAACTAHVQAMAGHYGRDSEQHQRAQGTWLACLSRLFSMGLGADTHVHRDGDLSLLITTGSGFVYALIFHGDTRRCVAGDGCTAVIADDSTAHTISSGTVIAEHDHTPAFPSGAPRPGQWSFHS